MKLKKAKTPKTRRRAGKKTAAGGATANATMPRRGTGRSGSTARRTTSALRTKNAKNAPAG